jgi:hypothetical protein
MNVTCMAPHGQGNTWFLQWISDNAFHVIAVFALRLGSPRRARAWTKQVARLWPRVWTLEAAEAVRGRLGGRGTCLTRAVAVAARCPGSFVVVGGQVPPRGSGRSFEAHAWVEVSGRCLGRENQRWIELGRI